jgi:plasmid stabilization system protein ParE
MKYKVVFVNHAINDLAEIEKYISTSDSETRADKIINNIIDTCHSLEKFPFRGHCPNELIEQNANILEVNYKVYRIFYEVENNSVIIESILDGRRNIRELLLGRIPE